MKEARELEWPFLDHFIQDLISDLEQWILWCFSISDWNEGIKVPFRLKSCVCLPRSKKSCTCLPRSKTNSKHLYIKKRNCPASVTLNSGIQGGALQKLLAQLPRTPTECCEYKWASKNLRRQRAILTWLRQSFCASSYSFGGPVCLGDMWWHRVIWQRHLLADMHLI